MIYIITFEHDKKTAMATIGRLDEYYYIYLYRCLIKFRLNYFDILLTI